MPSSGRSTLGNACSQSVAVTWEPLGHTVTTFVSRVAQSDNHAEVGATGAIPYDEC